MPDRRKKGTGHPFLIYQRMPDLKKERNRKKEKKVYKEKKERKRKKDNVLLTITHSQIDILPIIYK